MIAALALLAALASTGPRVVVIQTATGLGDDDTTAVAARLDDELRAAGVSRWALGAATLVTPDCIASAPCVQELLASAQAGALVVVDILRAGKRVNLTARLYDGSGAPIATETTTTSSAALLDGALLPAPFAARLRALPPQPVMTTTPSSAAAAAVASVPAAAAPIGDDERLPPLGIGGIILAAVGGLLVVGGAAVALAQAALRADPEAPGSARAATAVTIPAAVTTAAVGVSAGVGGVVLLLVTAPSASAVGG